MDVINPIPALLPGLRDAALRGTLIPFVGAGASRLAGCPNWTEFADRALRYFVDQGKFSHGQLAQLGQQPPRVKLSIALGLQSQHKLAINFDAILYPEGRNTNPKGRRLYEALSNLGKTFVTTKTRLVAHRIVSHPPPGWNQKCSNLARFLEPSSWFINRGDPRRGRQAPAT